MNEPMDEVYFKWLYAKVASVEVPTPSLTYYTLLAALHGTEFLWLIPGDDNRVEDGLDIRKEFIIQASLEDEDLDPAWVNIPCSVLEMLIGFSRRAEFQTDESAKHWFWVFMKNLGLDELNDAATRVTEKVSDVLDQFIWRTYNRNGEGGLFPLSSSGAHDQTKVEIWYQFCEYLVDQEKSEI